MEGFLSALALPLTEPVAGLLALSLALLALPDWRARFDRAAPVALVCLGLGIVVAPALRESLPLTAFALAGVVAAGVLVALAGDRATAPAVVAAAPLSLLLGAFARPDPGPPLDVAATLAGGTLALVLPTILLGGLTDWVREAPGRRLAQERTLRIAAAWLAAVALMLGALLLQPAA